jgi:hypothetical protein
VEVSPGYGWLVTQQYWCARMLVEAMEEAIS